MYRRVIPRDLFNEANLLKCLGRLALLIHDGAVPAGLSAVHDGDEFRIDQDAADGSILVTSKLDFYAGSHRLILSSPLNSKRNYPLTCMTADGEIEVFEDYDDRQGWLSPDFVAWVEKMVLASKTGI